MAVSCTHAVVINKDVLFVFRACDGFLLAFDDRSVSRILHVILGLSEQQLLWRSVEMFLTSVLQTRYRKKESELLLWHRRNKRKNEGTVCSVWLYPIQDALFLLIFKVFLFDSEGLMEQLQLGRVCLQVDLRSLLVRLPRKDWAVNTWSTYV